MTTRQKNSCISFSLFGYNREKHANSFDFRSYLRDLALNLRANSLIYPEFEIVLNLDKQTYEGFKRYFDSLEQDGKIVLNVLNEEPIFTRAMLWRLLPVWFKRPDGTPRYDFVLCRDLDSLSTYRERCAFEDFKADGTAVHIMNDSISHSIPVMGGMCAFNPAQLSKVVRFKVINTFQRFIDRGKNLNFMAKGTDQTLLCKQFYDIREKPPTTEHAMKGRPPYELNPFGRTRIEIRDIDGLTHLKDSDELIVHIGQAGFARERVLEWYRSKVEDEFNKYEQEFKTVFYWQL